MPNFPQELEEITTELKQLYFYSLGNYKTDLFIILILNYC